MKLCFRLSLIFAFALLSLSVDAQTKKRKVVKKQPVATNKRTAPPKKAKEVVTREEDFIAPSTTADKTKKDKPLVVVEQMPMYEGGESAMYKYIGKNLAYPPAAIAKGIQGRVTVRFVVTKTGALDDVMVIRGLDPDCDKEAVRIIKNMPKWQPGKHNGAPADVYYTIPIVFKLN